MSCPKYCHALRSANDIVSEWNGKSLAGFLDRTPPACTSPISPRRMSGGLGGQGGPWSTKESSAGLGGSRFCFVPAKCLDGTERCLTLPPWTRGTQFFVFSPVFAVYNTSATLCSNAEPEEAAPEDSSHKSARRAFTKFVREGPSRGGARDACDDRQEGVEEEPQGKEPLAVYEQVQGRTVVIGPQRTAGASSYQTLPDSARLCQTRPDYLGETILS